MTLKQKIILKPMHSLQCVESKKIIVPQKISRTEGDGRVVFSSNPSLLTASHRKRGVIIASGGGRGGVS